MVSLQMPVTKEQFFYYVSQLESVNEEWQTKKLRTLLNCFKMLYHQAHMFEFSSKFINTELRLHLKHLLPYSIQVEVTPFELKSNREMEYFLTTFEKAVTKRETCQYERRMSDTFRSFYSHNSLPSEPCCVFCETSDHQNYNCPMAYRNRVAVIKTKRLCFSCLRPGHLSRDCMKDIQCRYCGLDHYGYMCDRNYTAPRSTRPNSAWDQMSHSSDEEYQ